MHGLPLRRGCCHDEETAILEDLLYVPHGRRLEEACHLLLRTASRSGELRGESIRLVPNTNQVFLSGVRLRLGILFFALSALQPDRESLERFLLIPTHIGEVLRLGFKTKFLLVQAFCTFLGETFTLASI